MDGRRGRGKGGEKPVGSNFLRGGLTRSRKRAYSSTVAVRGLKRVSRGMQNKILLLLFCEPAWKLPGGRRFCAGPSHAWEGKGGWHRVRGAAARRTAMRVSCPRHKRVFFRTRLATNVFFSTEKQKEKKSFSNSRSRLVRSDRFSFSEKNPHHDTGCPTGFHAECLAYLLLFFSNSGRSLRPFRPVTNIL